MEAVLLRTGWTLRRGSFNDLCSCACGTVQYQYRTTTDCLGCSSLVSREAAKGYNRCAVCAFENFKASRFCTLCGESIVVLEDDAYGDSGRKQQEGAGVELHQSNTNAENSSAAVKPDLTQRQIRAR